MHNQVVGKVMVVVVLFVNLLLDYGIRTNRLILGDDVELFHADDLLMQKEFVSFASEGVHHAAPLFI